MSTNQTQLRPYVDDARVTSVLNGPVDLPGGFGSNGEFEVIVQAQRLPAGGTNGMKIDVYQQSSQIISGNGYLTWQGNSNCPADGGVCPGGFINVTAASQTQFVIIEKCQVYVMNQGANG